MEKLEEDIEQEEEAKEEATQVRELALFAGVGGGILASKLAGHRIMAAVEIDSYCRNVLMVRQEEGHLDPFPIFSDIHSFQGAYFNGHIDVITAGFPCTPFSVAGKREGEVDEKNLWPETRRVIGEVQPGRVFLENVPGLLRMYGDTVLGDLSALGFDCRWGVVSARDSGARHLRNRWWCLANSESR